MKEILISPFTKYDDTYYNNIRFLKQVSYKCSIDYKTEFEAPTQSLLQKYLIEVHNINI